MSNIYAGKWIQPDEKSKPKKFISEFEKFP